MKKILVLFAIVALASCGNETKTEVKTCDSTAVCADSTSVCADSTEMVVDTTKAETK